MLYLLGGASRAGKSTLARRLLSEHRVPYFSLDVLAMGLANGYPRFGLDPDDTAEARATLLWPLVRAMAVNLLEEEPIHPTYLIEGDALLPEQAAELQTAYPGRICACFVGYAQIDPAAKLAEVRGGEAGWLSDCSDGEVLSFVADMVRFSRVLESDCAQFGIPYFDCSAGLQDALARAYRYLVGGAFTGTALPSGLG